MIKILKENTPKNNQKDYKLARRLGEIILYLIAGIQLFQEFSDSMYFTQFLIILSLVGEFVFIFGAIMKRICMLENYENEYLTGHKEMFDFHNNFIASMFIPMLFLFNEDNVIFTGTFLWDLKSIKLIILSIAFISLIFYRTMVFLADRYHEKMQADEEFEESDYGIDYYNALLELPKVGLVIDGILCLINFILVYTMEWKNVYFSNFTYETFFFIFLCVFVLFFINDKKHIILISVILLSVANISYNSYMQFSEVKTYDFGISDYSNFYRLSGENKKFIEFNCRFEKDENNNGVFKCFFILFEDGEDGFKITEEAVAYGNYEATEYKKSFSEWQDRDEEVYIKKDKLDAGEMPVKFRILNEVVECNENGLLKDYINNDNYLSKNYDNETEIIIIGENYIDFRGNELKKIKEADEYIDETFDRIKM